MPARGNRSAMLPDLQPIIIGIGVGLLVAAPIGPVNILAIQRTIERGVLGGLAVGIGVVIADGLLVLAAALGVTAISGFMLSHRLAIQSMGALVLVIFGLRLLRTMPRALGKAEPQDDGWTIPKAAALTLGNPGAVLGMFAVVGSASSALDGLGDWPEACLFAASVVFGSLVWWMGLSVVIARIAPRINDRKLLRINQLAGLVLIGFGIVLLAEVLFHPLVRLLPEI